MTEIKPRIEIIKKNRGKITEYLSKDCMGCAETAPSWLVNCSDYWEKVVEDLELQSERKEILLKYYVILTEIDPNEVDPMDDDI
jgi:hypothetical protein